jgi:hypothetical protein
VAVCLLVVALGYGLKKVLTLLWRFETNSASRFNHHFITGWPLFLCVLVAAICMWGLDQVGRPFIKPSDASFYWGVGLCIAGMVLLRNFRRTPIHFALVGSLFQACIIGVGLWGGWIAVAILVGWVFGDFVSRHPFVVVAVRRW